MLSRFRGFIDIQRPKSRVGKRIVALASGTAMAQVVTIGVMPIITRLYTPGEFGVISLFLAFFAFWAPILSLRYEYALLAVKDDSESHVVQLLAKLIVPVMVIFSLPVLWGLHHFDILGFSLVPIWALLAAIPMLLGHGWFMVFRCWALRAGAVKDVARATVVRSAAKAGTRVLLGLGPFGVVGLFIAEIIGAWTALWKLSQNVVNHFASSRPQRISYKSLTAAARKFVKFPLLESPSTLINQVALLIPLPMIAGLHGAAAAGWFGLARMMVRVPNAQIGTAVADVMHMEFSEAIAEGNGLRARLLFYKLFGQLALAGLLPLIGIMVVGPWAVPLVFGADWYEAGMIAVCIAPWMYAAFVVSPLSRILSVLQVQEYKVFYDFFSLALIVLAFFISKNKNFSLLETVLSISTAGFISYCCYMGLLLFLIKKMDITKS